MVEINKDKLSFGDLEAEQKQIEHCYLTLRFGQKVRHEVLACYKKCGGKIGYPFRVDPLTLMGKDEICFGDCMNLNFEKGPFLHELGKIPEDAIPKKFIWAHSL
jgi:hypothetical protein